MKLLTHLVQRGNVTMLVSNTRLMDTPVMSLHLGGKVASLGAAIINPANLRIAAFEISSPAKTRSSATYLLTSDIREYGTLGVIIDTTDEFITTGDVIKLDELIQLNFTLSGMRVVTKDGQKLGRVSGYTVDTLRFEIQQLSVRGGFFKSIQDPTGLLVHRSQIVEITNEAIIVKSSAQKAAEPSSASARTVFTNPFRSGQSPQPESSSTTSP